MYGLFKALKRLTASALARLTLELEAEIKQYQLVCGHEQRLNEQLRYNKQLNDEFIYRMSNIQSKLSPHSRHDNRSRPQHATTTNRVGPNDWRLHFPASSLTFNVTRIQSVKDHTEAVPHWGSVGRFLDVKMTSGYVTVLIISICWMPFIFIDLWKCFMFINVSCIYSILIDVKNIE